MTETEIRIAIAEKCGWTRVTTSEKVMHWPGGFRDAKVIRWAKNILEIGVHKLPMDAVEENGLPDYPNDLNAMHEAEKLVINNEDYLGELARVCLRDMGGGVNMTFATARQRALAFVKTFGLDENEKH